VATCLQEMKYCDLEWPEERLWTVFDIWFIIWKNAQFAPKRSAFIGFFTPVICTYGILLSFMYWWIS
jgi:hypothetical protein